MATATATSSITEINVPESIICGDARPDWRDAVLPWRFADYNTPLNCLEMRNSFPSYNWICARGRTERTRRGNEESGRKSTTAWRVRATKKELLARVITLSSSTVSHVKPEIEEILPWNPSCSMSIWILLWRCKTLYCQIFCKLCYNFIIERE